MKRRGWIGAPLQTWRAIISPPPHPPLCTPAAFFFCVEKQDFKNWSVLYLILHHPQLLSTTPRPPTNTTTTTTTPPLVRELPLRSSSFFAVSAFPLPAGDYRSQEMKELPIREGAALYCTCCYRRLYILASLQDKHDYIPRLCRFNHTPLPTSATQPLAIFPDMCNQLEQQILAGIKKKKKKMNEILNKKCHLVQQANTVCSVYW